LFCAATADKIALDIFLSKCKHSACFMIYQ